MKTITLVVVATILAVQFKAYAGTITADSCDFAHVQAAVDKALSGDTVRVPAGECVWEKRLVINKGIILQGAGSDKTIIVSGVDGEGNVRYDSYHLVTYRPDYPGANEPFRLSGFTFDCKGRLNALKLANSTIHKLTKIRVDHNRFINGVYGPSIIQVSGHVYGVMDNNYFFKNAGNNNAVDFENGSDELTWLNYSYDYKSGEAFFFEDNECDLTDVAHDAGEAGRSVMRYNNYNFITEDYTRSAMMVHGAQKGAHCANMSLEYYGNKISGIKNVAPLIGSRGGKHIAFYNEVNAPGGTYIDLRNMYPDNCPSNCAEPFNSGINFIKAPDGQPQHVSNSYFWINKEDGNECDVFLGELDCCTGAGGYGPWPDCCIHGEGVQSIQEDYQWWEYKPNFDGTSGVGCGLTANRPSACTPGVAYWATEQSCYDLTGMTGAHPVNPISGTLYKCVSQNSWEPYYTPYPYPHPLRNEEGGIVPNAPKGLIIR